MLLINVVFSLNAIGEELSYVDYISLMESPVKDISSFNKVKVNRITNIILSQSRKVDELNLPIFINNVDELISSPSFHEKVPILLEAKVNALMIVGEFNQALDIMKKDILKKNTRLNAVHVYAYLKVGEVRKAIYKYNSVTPQDFFDAADKYLSLAIDMITNYNVDFESLSLPKKYISKLSSYLFKYYDTNRLIKFAYGELLRMIQLADNPIDKYHIITKGIEYTENNNLHQENIDLKYAFLKNIRNVSLTNEDKENIFNYAGYIIDNQHDYNDKEILEAEKYVATEDHDYVVPYLKHYLKIHDKNITDNEYVSNTIKLAKLISDEKLILALYNKKDSLTKRQRSNLIESYFKIDGNGGDSAFYMASELSNSIAQCSGKTPDLARVLKGNKFAKDGDINNAYKCYFGVNINELDLTDALKIKLKKEQESVNYFYAKKQGADSEFLAIANNTKRGDIILDGSLFFIESNELTQNNIQSLSSLVESNDSILTLKQKDKIKLSILAKLRLQGDTSKSLLLKQLLLEPDDNAFEIAWIYKENNDKKNALHFIIRGLKFSKTVSIIDITKSIGYLNLHFSSLTNMDINVLNSERMTNKVIDNFLLLKSLSISTDKVFNKIDKSSSVFSRIKVSLNTYKSELNKLPKKVSVANYSNLLWARYRLNSSYASYLRTLINDSYDNRQLRSLLENQMNKLYLSSKKIRLEIIHNAKSDIADVNVMRSLKSFVDEVEK